MKNLTSTRLILLVTLYISLFLNVSFFSNVLKVYPPDSGNILFLISLSLFLGTITSLIFSLLCYKYTIKPVLILTVITSSFAAYFMDSYNIIIDDTMIESITHTNMNESLDLFSLKLVTYAIILGLLPAFFIYKININYLNTKSEIISRLKLLVFTVLTMVSVILIFSDFYASFFREHKSLRYYANPSFYIYSSYKYVKGLRAQDGVPFEIIAKDATISVRDSSEKRHRKLFVLIVGETAREDRFSLNGYERETNPLLSKQNVINFSNFWACGTSTAISVPCMFSVYNQSEYNKSKAYNTQNVLDILQSTGVNVFWLDNNSDSKGVAKRITFVDFRTAENNTVCDRECRDPGMVRGMQSFIDKTPTGDLFFVLHQMGNHGPAYYKRYPDRFEKFKPTCKTNQLEQCNKEEIDNAYDNAILYTDYFLSQTIDFLKQKDSEFSTGMFYISDHGESLGEYNTYLHGLPNFIAPDAQLRVPVVMWFGENYPKDKIASLKEVTQNKLSHDNVFHTILGIMDIETEVYNDRLDILKNIK